MLDFKNSFMLGSQEGKEGGGGDTKIQTLLPRLLQQVWLFFCIKVVKLKYYQFPWVQCRGNQPSRQY